MPTKHTTIIITIFIIILDFNVIIIVCPEKVLIWRLLLNNIKKRTPRYDEHKHMLVPVQKLIYIGVSNNSLNIPLPIAGDLLPNLPTGKIPTISEPPPLLANYLTRGQVGTQAHRCWQNCPKIALRTHGYGSSVRLLYGPNHRLSAIGRSPEYIQTKSEFGIFTKTKYLESKMEIGGWGWIPAVSGQMHKSCSCRSGGG